MFYFQNYLHFWWKISILRAKYDNKLFKSAAGLCVTEHIIRKRAF